MFTAVVHAADGVRFSAYTSTRHELVAQLTRYVRRYATHVLEAQQTWEFAALLARGERERAVEVYFANVGRRWDHEWLVTTAGSIDDDERQHISARINAVAEEDDTPDAL